MQLALFYFINYFFLLFLENFELIMVDSTDLQVLDVCQVCGSYQCPYCPMYNLTTRLRFSAFSLLFFVLIFYITLK